MQTNVEIDDDFIDSMMKSTGAKTRNEGREAAVRLLEKMKGQGAALDALRGLGWEGDLEQSRLNRIPDDSWQNGAS